MVQALAKKKRGGDNTSNLAMLQFVKYHSFRGAIYRTTANQLQLETNKVFTTFSILRWNLQYRAYHITQLRLLRFDVAVA